MIRAPRRLLAVLMVSAAVGASFASASSPADRSSAHSKYSTTRTFDLGPGRAERRFTLRERSGVILLSRLTVPEGVSAYVDATIPHLAGTRFSTAPPNDPARVCTSRGTEEVCTQSQEWCPMPAALWRLHLVKLSGPAGPVRIDYVVAPPPNNK